MTARFDPRRLQLRPWHRRVMLFLRQLWVSLCSDWRATQYELARDRGEHR